ncbi:TolC family protein [Mucilaginibacter sp. PAMB04274]|uniref:TolC family protein n=1 Tax=Mucilaginibacter sp. PAMB04274 TaxID=3138568 RepID=UPI0031F66F19
MKKNIGIILLLALSGQAAFSQIDLKISLKEAQELGLKNRSDVKADALRLEASRIEKQKAKQAWLPEISANANVSYHPQLQATLIPAGFVPGLNEPQILALGAKSISIYSLELNQPILKATLSSDVKLAKNSEAMEAEKKRGRDIVVKQQISQAYLNTQLKDLQWRLAKQDENRFFKYYQVAEGKFKSGALIENEYLRAKLDYENACHQTTTSLQSLGLSIKSLRYELNVDTLVKLILTDSIDVNPVVLPAIQEDITLARNRTEIKQLQLQREADELNEKKQRQSVMPVISLYGNYAQQFLNGNFNYDYSNSRWWSPFSSVGLKLSLPITGQLTNRTKVQQSRLRSQETILRQEQQTAKVNYEIRQSTTEIANAIQNVRRADNSFKLAQRVYENQEKQLALGAFSYDSLLNTESSVLNAERNYIKSVYDYFISRLNYEIAIGGL